MIPAAQILTDPAAAPFFAAAGLAARVASPVFRRRDQILMAQLASTCLFAASYTAIDQPTATAVCLVGGAQTTVALIAGERAWLNRTGYVFLPVVLALGVATFTGLPTILAVTACCLMMIGRLQTGLARMRAVQLFACPFGMAHDLVVGAWLCLAGAVLSFAIAALAFRREMRSGAPA